MTSLKQFSGEKLPRVAKYNFTYIYILENRSCSLYFRNNMHMSGFSISVFFSLHEYMYDYHIICPYEHMSSVQGIG